MSPFARLAWRAARNVAISFLQPSDSLSRLAIMHARRASRSPVAGQRFVISARHASDSIGRGAS